jgi:hypothetical protein
MVSTMASDLSAAKRRIRTLLVLFTLVVAMTSLLVGFVPADAAKEAPKNVPPGNKGTVKIDDETFNGIPDNDPHPGCIFHLQFFFFPRETTATYEFALHPPTKDGSTGGSIELDPLVTPNAEAVIDLTTFLKDSGVPPHPIQGWHIKLTIHAPGAQGADVKHKVFWVNCPAAAPSPTPSVSVSPSISVSPSVSITPTVSVSPTVIVSPSGSATVAAVTTKKPVKVLGVTLGKTGSRPFYNLALWGAAFVAIGIVLVLSSSRRKRAPRGVPL